MKGLSDIIKSLTDRIRALETSQEGNGFVPYFYHAVYTTGTTLFYGIHGCTKLLAVGQYSIYEFPMPRKVASLEEAVLIYIARRNGTWDYTIDAQGGYCGEQPWNHLDSITDNNVPTVQDIIVCLDISAALTPYQAGDMVGLKVRMDAITGDDGPQIILLGIRLR